MSLKLVIFDVDGLLLDTERVWQDVWYDTARDFGIDDWKREDFLNVVGRSGQPVYDYNRYRVRAESMQPQRNS